MRHALLSLLLITSARADDLIPDLPASAKEARAEYDKVLAEEQSTHEAALKQAAADYRDALAKLQKEATKAGRLDEAVALRDAAKALERGAERPAVRGWLKTRRDFKVWFSEDTMAIGPAGWRMSDWKQGLVGRVEYLGGDSIRITNPVGAVNAGSSNTITFSPDRSRALFVDPEGKANVITLKR